MTAADRWAAELAAWAIPDELLAAVDESPYGWPVELWRRRSEAAEAAPEPETTRIVRELAGPDGSILDIGAGTGRASLPLAAEGRPLVAVEKDPGMAAALRDEAAARGIPVEVVEGAWPDVADRAGPADVVMSANVVYDVADIVPFLRAMHDHARRAVVVELTERHPWANLAPWYRALHGLDRPDGPTWEDLVAVIREAVGVDPAAERWSRPGGLWYESWDELVAVLGRRLVLPRQRRSQLRRLLEGEVEVDRGRLYLGDRERRMVTVWWRTAPE